MNRPIDPKHLAERMAERLNARDALAPLNPLAEPPDLAVARPSPGPRHPVPPSPGPAITEPDGTSQHGATISPAALPPRPAAPAPFIGIADLERGGLVMSAARVRIKEEFRIAASQILREMGTAKSASTTANMLLVTSAKPGEGKTFTALNLAATMAAASPREILLVDTDAKQKALSYQLGVAEAPGLINLAADPFLKVESMLVQTEIKNLAVLPFGPRTAESIGMSTRPIATAVERLAQRFPRHVIILDTPPCLSTSEPTTLAPLVGRILMVVEAGRTQRDEVEAALDLVTACPTVMLLLNKIKLTTSNTFGAYYDEGRYS